MTHYITYPQLLYGEGMPTAISGDVSYRTGYVDSSFVASTFTATLASKSTLQSCIASNGADNERRHFFHVVFVDLSGSMHGVVVSSWLSETRNLHDTLQLGHTFCLTNARFRHVMANRAKDGTRSRQIRMILDSSAKITELGIHSNPEHFPAPEGVPSGSFDNKLIQREAWWLFAETWNAVDLYLTSKPPSYDGRNEVMPTDFLPEATGRTAQYLADLIQELLDTLNGSRWSRYRRIFRRSLIKLCRTSGCLPTTFFLYGICNVAQQSLGHGSYSDVYFATYRGYVVALKRLRLFLTGQPGDPSLKSFYQEAVLWRQLRHPNILPFLGIDAATSQLGPGIVSPFLSRGDVRKAMMNMPTHEIPFDNWLLGIAKGLDYLHGEGISHGDVRGANILVDDNLCIKLGDFGLSTFIDSSTLSSGTHPGGTVRWMSPELLKTEISRPNPMSDIYSFGCTCIELYTQKKPFPHIILDVQVMAQVQRGSRPQRPVHTWKDMPDEIWSLVSLCLHDQPTKRPSMAQVVDHLSQISRINTMALASGIMRQAIHFSAPPSTAPSIPYSLPLQTKMEFD